MFSELVKKTRSYRNFKGGEALSPDLLRYLVELCRFTPSTANRQPLKFACVCEKDMCDEIFPCLAWAGYYKENKPPFKGNEPSGYIIVCYDKTISPESPEVDVGICAQTIVLGASEKGIGACMIGSFNKEKVSSLLRLRENIVPRLVIALGVPNEKVVIVDETDGDIKYYRDKTNTHFVPKRPLDEIILR
ncbi:MAG: nitroreductase family protein [Clostridiales bacterium]|nr:nitroreductase family protein [Clostridiales bacterium]